MNNFTQSLLIKKTPYLYHLKLFVDIVVLFLAGEIKCFLVWLA